MIQANDFKRQWEDLREDALAAFDKVGASGWYVLGEEVRAFEGALAALWGFPHAAGVASGLDATEILLRALGCGPGDRVLTTPISAFATTLAIVKLGAVPVFVDTDDQGLIDLGRCHELLKTRRDIRYFVPVHLYGFTLDATELLRLRDEHGLRMVEDCAQSMAAVGEVAATSFYPTKNLGAMGDGGAILGRDAALDTRVRALRDYGQTAKYRHDFIGYNSRLDELQAAFLRRACLPRLARWTARRREIAGAYLNGIKNPAVRLPAPSKRSEPSWHLFPVWIDPRLARSQFGTHYPIAIPDQKALNGVPFEAPGGYENARRLCASEFSLPIHPYLNDDEVAEVIAAVNSL
ncbi:MAG: DegT/DnrJ/EryC1/StrS aminotransferase family protein [Acidobacteriia bacterium]|nr:DegT/DnrJ/EryC1/StrS aminotransferase family protein [Terriglobia bacterium]